MSQISPQTKAFKVQKELTQLFDKELPNELQKRRLHKEINDIKKVDPSAGYMLEGILASRVGAYKDVKQSFEGALKNSRDQNDVVFANYIKALSECSRAVEALEMIDKNQFIGYNIAYNALSISLGLGDLKEAKFYLDYLKKNDKDDNPKLKELNHKFQLFENALYDTQLSSKDLNQVLLLVLDTFFYFGLKCQRRTIINLNSDRSALTPFYYVEGSAKDIFNIEMKFSEKFAELENYNELVKKVTPVILKMVY